MALTSTERLEKKIDSLLSVLKPRKTWVKSTVITSLTVWNAEKLRQARENGYVEYKKDDDGFWYNLNSIHDKFFKSN